jgi:hypothetical protein
MNFSNASLQTLSVHFVGNKSLEQALLLSQQPLKLDENISLKLKDYFLSRFLKINERYTFSHPELLENNVMFNLISTVFADNLPLHSASEHSAQHLYEHSVHPKIKQGELYVALFTDCEYNDNTAVDVIGIFKTENKNPFFEVNHLDTDFSIDYKEGIDFNKLDKGCLIFNLNEQQGFEVCIIDNQNKGEEALYWKEYFLGLTQQTTTYQQTNQALSITKRFISKQLPEDIAVSKTEQIDLLNRSLDYFRENDTYSKKEFENTVLVDDAIINSYRKFEDSHKQTNESELSESFEISPQAVKKQAKTFKSILKLDKNFHIYIHGDSELIQKGIEKDGRKFYKIYFENEQ